MFSFIIALCSNRVIYHIQWVRRPTCSRTLSDWCCKAHQHFHLFRAIPSALTTPTSVLNSLVICLWALVCHVSQPSNKHTYFTYECPFCYITALIPNCLQRTRAPSGPALNESQTYLCNGTLKTPGQLGIDVHTEHATAYWDHFNSVTVVWPAINICFHCFLLRWFLDFPSPLSSGGGAGFGTWFASLALAADPTKLVCLIIIYIFVVGRLIACARIHFYLLNIEQRFPCSCT